MKKYSILVIDANKKSYDIKIVADDLIKEYIGGYALALKLLDDSDEFKRKNALMIFSGALSSYNNVSSRFSLLYSNNLKLSHSSIGGDFSIKLKPFADAIIVLNSFDDLTIVNIGKKIEFIDANDYKDLLNSETFSRLKQNLGKNSSSIYISKSALNNDKIARVIHDKYHGASSGLASAFYNKNIKAINIVADEITDDHIFDDYKNEDEKRCKNCFIGCSSHKKKKAKTIFDKKNASSTFEKRKMELLNKKIDEYGIDQIALSKSIEFAKENLNDIYDFKDLDQSELEIILDKLFKRNDEKYIDLLQGRDFLANKYNIKLEKRKKKESFRDSSILMDSIGLCLFTNSKLSYDDYNNLLEKHFNSKFSTDDLESLSQKVKLIEKNFISSSF